MASSRGQSWRTPAGTDTCGRAAASGHTARISGQRSVAVQSGGPDVPSVCVARPVERSSSNSRCHSSPSSAGRAPRESSTSCSSSASRTSGQASLFTRAIASGSSRPRSPQRLGRQRPPHRHRPRPPLLQGGVVEERVRIGVEQLVGERRRLAAIEADQFDRARLDVAQHGEPAVQIGGLMQAVVDRLPDDRLIGHVDVAGHVFLTGRLGGEDGGQQVVGPHALQVRRHPFALSGHA